MNTQAKQIDWVKVFSIITAIVFAFLWLKGCTSSNPEPQIAKVEVTVPEVQGVFEPKKPDHELIKLPKNDKSKIVKVENPINQQLVAENERLKQYATENEKLKLAFVQERDSLKKQLLFEQVAQLNNFSTKYEDEYLELYMEGVVQGQVKEITPSYKIKSKAIEVPVKQKETVLRVLMGGGFGINKDLNQATWKLNLSLQNKKGNIIRGSYQRIGNQDYLLGEYDVSIFNFKR
jgi:type IV secretory pathway VirB10-like protein